MKPILSILFICISFYLALSQTVFTDVSSSTGLLSNTQTESIAVGDFNNDGFDDFYACSPFGKSQLYQNNGDGTFTEVGESLDLALDENTYTQAAVWGDLNNDGFLDLYVANKSIADQLFMNNGDGTFEEKSFEVGIYHQGFPKSVNLADVNNDGFLDIYISNFNAQNALYLSSGDAQKLTFTNYIYASGTIDEGKAMGTIFFDYDKDDDVDLYLTHDHNELNILYQNDGNGVFTDVSAASNANTKSYAMGVDVGDINRDGWLDIYVANDYAFSLHKNILYRNLGNLQFAKAEENEAICNEFGTFGTATLNYNLDGYINILAANRHENEALQLFKNANRQKHWLGLNLVGTTSNYSAIGSRVELTDNLENIHYQELSAGQS